MTRSQRSGRHPSNGAATPPATSSVRLVTTLMLSGLLAGVVLAAVYVATAPAIADNRAAALARAVLKVVPGAVDFTAHPELGPGVYTAVDDAGQRLGYAIEAEGPGFMDTIRLLYGIDPRTRTVVGLEILESRETPGLGDKIMTDPAFVQSFAHLSVSPAIVPVTDGPRTRDNQVDCIAGATISSKAVVRIIQSSVAQRLPNLIGAEETGARPP